MEGNVNHIIPSYCHLQVICRSPADGAVSHRFLILQSYHKNSMWHRFDHIFNNLFKYCATFYIFYNIKKCQIQPYTNHRLITYFNVRYINSSAAQFNESQGLWTDCKSQFHFEDRGEISSSRFRGDVWSANRVFEQFLSF